MHKKRIKQLRILQVFFRIATIKSATSVFRSSIFQYRYFSLPPYSMTPMLRDKIFYCFRNSVLCWQRSEILDLIAISLAMIVIARLFSLEISIEVGTIKDPFSMGR